MLFVQGVQQNDEGKRREASADLRFVQGVLQDSEDTRRMVEPFFELSKGA